MGGAEELAPPSKRVAVNGAKTKDDVEGKEDSWIEVRVTGQCFASLHQYTTHSTRLSCTLARRTWPCELSLQSEPLISLD